MSLPWPVFFKETAQPSAPHVWIKSTNQEAMRAGLARDLAEEKANVANDQVVAPACPACGKPVSDKEWDAHRRDVHDRERQVVRPYGKADAREALFTAPDKDRLDQKIAQWRGSHPGVVLEYLGDGTNKDTRLIWVRFRLRNAPKRIVIATQGDRA